MKYSIALLVTCILTTACTGKTPLTKTGSVCFVAPGISEQDLASAAKTAASELGYNLLDQSAGVGRTQFQMHFEAESPNRIVMFAGGLKSDDYFISSFVDDPADRTRYEFESSALLRSLQARLGASSSKIEPTSCAARPN